MAGGAYCVCWKGIRVLWLRVIRVLWLRVIRVLWLGVHIVCVGKV